MLRGVGAGPGGRQHHGASATWSSIVTASPSSAPVASRTLRFSGNTYDPDPLSGNTEVDQRVSPMATSTRTLPNPRRGPAVRIRMMEEAVRLIRTRWQEKRATFHGEYFHVRDAILEPKPVQEPHPPILIGGGGEQLTLRAVARVGNACNVFGDPDTVARKLDVLRRHCEREGRTYDEIERTSLTSVLLARDELALKAKRERLNAPDPFRGFAVTVPQAVALVGRYRDVGVQLFITGIYKNDPETLELLATEVMPHFA